MRKNDKNAKRRQKRSRKYPRAEVVTTTTAGERERFYEEAGAEQGG